jgi:hypothetical protein
MVYEAMGNQKSSAQQTRKPLANEDVSGTENSANVSEVNQRTGHFSITLW